jgi:TetR/AcrR family transcriptional regulator, cholesterol catabolism regulator
MKETIAGKAAELFSKYGIRSITMDDIAANMGISKKTLYTWFMDKNELVETVFMEPLKQAEQDCLAKIAAAQNAIQEAIQCWRCLRHIPMILNEVLLHDLQKYHHQLFARYEQFKKIFLYGMICKNIERGKKEELYREDIEPEIIALHEIAVLDINYSSLATQNRKWPAAVISKQLMLYYLHGLVTGKGQRLIKNITHNQQL